MNVIELAIFRVGQVQFTDEQIQKMIKRTESKLQALPLKIQYKVHSDLWPLHTGEMSEKDVELLLTTAPYVPKPTLKVFLIKKDLTHQLDSWTYNPLIDSENHSPWEGVIFINELFNTNTDEHYKKLGYLPSNDTLMHELGHILLDRADHDKGSEFNFFHDLAEKTNDHISSEQRQRMLKSSYVKKVKK